MVFGYIKFSFEVRFLFSFFYNFYYVAVGNLIRRVYSKAKKPKKEAGGAAVCRQRPVVVDPGRAPPDLLPSTSQ